MPILSSLESSAASIATCTNVDESTIPVSTSPLLALEDQVESVAVLFQVAISRLRPSQSLLDKDGRGLSGCKPNRNRPGRLVFWLPTTADTQPEAVVAALQGLIGRLRGENSPCLQVLRVSPEKLNSKLWRWLCVLQRI